MLWTGSRGGERRKRNGTERKKEEEIRRFRGELASNDFSRARRCDNEDLSEYGGVIVIPAYVLSMYACSCDDAPTSASIPLSSGQDAKYSTYILPNVFFSLEFCCCRGKFIVYNRVLSHSPTRLIFARRGKSSCWRCMITERMELINYLDTVSPTY